MKGNIKSILFLVLYAVLLPKSLSLLNDQINTPSGPIKGILKTTNSGRPFYAYYSIPYAKPPIGPRRFLFTELADPWTEVLDATTEKNSTCYQLHHTNTEWQTEDCLFLNVFTPMKPSVADKKLPVLFNIHGGGFLDLAGAKFVGFGSPNYILDHDVILVTINYRLGIFGYLSTGDDVIPGNAGLKDQVVALKWVQQNIASFGGDPGRVTIVGQSLGAAAVAYHILSPMSKGLFSSAIMESGDALMISMLQKNPSELAFKTAAFIDARFEDLRDSRDLLRVLQNASALDIQAAAQKSANWALRQPGKVFFAPVIEAANNHSFLTKLPYESLEQGNINQVPVLMGICAEEGLMILDQFNVSARVFDADLSYVSPANLNIKNNSLNQEIGYLIRKKYAPGSTFTKDPLGLLKYFSDYHFVKPTTKHAELQSKFTSIFYYVFAYTGTMGGNTNAKFPGSNNVTHIEEMLYIFGEKPIETLPESDQLIHKRLVKLWTNFVIYSHPTPTPESLLQNITWPTVRSDRFQYLMIGNLNNTDLQIVEDKPNAENMAFWGNIYNKYGVRPFDTY